MRKALGAPANRNVYNTVFLRSLLHIIEIARFYGSAWVCGGVIEIRVNCHDLIGIGDRMREGRRSRMVIVSDSAGKMSIGIGTCADSAACLEMCHKIRKAMSEHDAQYELVGIMEIDDTYFGSPKPGKRVSGAEGKAKVVVAVEVREDKPRFATMQQVESMSEDDICIAIDGRLGEDITAHTDGWKAYGFLTYRKV